MKFSKINTKGRDEKKDYFSAFDGKMVIILIYDDGVVLVTMT